MAKQDEQAVELTPSEEKFAEELQAKMDGIERPADEDEDEIGSTSADEDEEIEGVTDDETQTDGDEDEDESTPEDGDEEGDTEEHGISDALYRAAIHQGWKPEEIKELVDSNPELATRTFEKLYDATNKISSEFARFGRTKAEQEKAAAAEKTKPAVDIEALKEEYGEDSTIVKTMEALLGALPAKADSVPASDANVRQIIDTFFSADGMKLYTDFYGTGNDKDKLTHGQMSRRMDVLNLADDIMTGAEAQGRKMEVTEALERAHMCVTEPIRSEVIRKEITSKVVKKAKGVTLKPSTTSKSQHTKAKTEKDLESIVNAKLAKTFGRK